MIGAKLDSEAQRKNLYQPVTPNKQPRAPSLRRLKQEGGKAQAASSKRTKISGACDTCPRFFAYNMLQRLTKKQ